MASAESLAEAFGAWVAHLKKPRTTSDQPPVDRAVDAIGNPPLSAEILARAEAHEWSPNELRVHLNGLEARLRQFDEIIRPAYSDFMQEGRLKRTLWQHIDYAGFYRQTTKTQRDEFQQPQMELRRFIATYLATPEYHYPYIDWLMIDAVTALSLVENTEWLLAQKFGAIAYGVCDGVEWKILLFKAVTKPLGFVLNWSLPALLAWWLSRYSLPAALIAGGLLYLSMIGGRIWRFVTKKGRAPSTRQRFEAILDDQRKAYFTLHGPVMHVPTVRAAFQRATEKGASWNQEVLTILDRLALNPPAVWRCADGHAFS